MDLLYIIDVLRMCITMFYTIVNIYIIYMYYLHTLACIYSLIISVVFVFKYAIKHNTQYYCSSNVLFDKLQFNVHSSIFFLYAYL